MFNGALRLLAAILVGGSSLALSGAVADAAVTPTTHAGADQSTHTVSVPMTGRRITPGQPVSPDGSGPTYNLGCGSAQLTVNASTHRFRILLHSTRGPITGGFYVVNTDGFGNLPVPGNLNGGSATSNNLGNIPVPGIFISQAFAGGTVFVHDGSPDGLVCFFVINAPWN